jgi:hypothetical protein
MNAPIRWDFISRAIAYYSGLGYRYVEVPWVVGAAAINVTLPPGYTAFTTMDGTLVGSAEQSFIQLMTDGKLSDGNYMACTPCFRDDTVDEYHQRTFMKVELIQFRKQPIPEPHMAALSVALEALDFFQSLTMGQDVRVKKTPDGLDIELRGVELGSYGYRSHEDFHWIYGTGLAEPRFSKASRLAV